MIFPVYKNYLQPVKRIVMSSEYPLHFLWLKSQLLSGILLLQMENSVLKSLLINKIAVD